MVRIHSPRPTNSSCFNVLPLIPASAGLPAFSSCPYGQPTASGKCGERLYSTKSPTFANLHALACCFLRLDFSVCPLFVGAGNTHWVLAALRRISRKALARGVSGIVLRAFSVLPKGTCTAPLRTFSHRSRKHSSGLNPQSINTVVASRSRNGSSGLIGSSPRMVARMPSRTRRIRVTRAANEALKHDYARLQGVNLSLQPLGQPYKNHFTQPRFGQSYPQHES